MFSLPIRGYLLLGVQLDDEVLLDRQIDVFPGGNGTTLAIMLFASYSSHFGHGTKRLASRDPLIFSRPRLPILEFMTIPGFTW
jgi:hypothetical protein